jgi:hypothetical protein
MELPKWKRGISLLKCREFSLGCSSRSPQMLRDVPQELAREGNYTRLTLSQAKHTGEQVFKKSFRVAGPEDAGTCGAKLWREYGPC